MRRTQNPPEDSATEENDTRECALNARDATTHSGIEASKAVVMESGVSSAGLRVGVRFRRLTTDPKLSDRRGWRGGCVVGRAKAAGWKQPP